MRYRKIDPSLFVKNRANLAQYLQPNSLVVLHSNDILPTNGDEVMPFHQNSNLFYLSGIDQAETLLLLYPDAPQASWKELLFVQATDEQSQIWEGERHTLETARDISGIAQVHWMHDFYRLFHTLMGLVVYVYLDIDEHPRAIPKVPTCSRRFARWCKEQYPLHRYERLAPIMNYLRATKSDPEIDLIREACKITAQGFRKILPLVKPGIMEYELEAALIGEFVRNGSRGFSYAPIVASGANACILHYKANDQSCQAGETILLDVGAEYAHYQSDCTRVVPVGGQLTPRQRAVYEAVLRIMRQAQTLLVPGNSPPIYHQQVGEIVTQELVELGLLDRTDLKNQSLENPAYKKYFMHGIGHHIGLDTHDVGNLGGEFSSGMVLTIEPGIYIREESLGIRLENVFVVREDGPENLMPNIPIEIEEIEELMHG